MAGSRKIPVDGERLEQEIKARKLNKVQASEKIGYSHSYLANCGSEGFISQKAMKLLEAVLGISYDDIKPEIPQDKNLIQLSKVREQKEKVEFFESCEERISNAVVMLNVFLDMIDQLNVFLDTIDQFIAIREQVENDLNELMTVQEVYQKTLKRVKETA